MARETGWESDFILWHLPYARGLGIIHAAGIFHGNEMEFAEIAVLRGDGMREDFAKLREEYLKP